MKGKQSEGQHSANIKPVSAQLLLAIVFLQFFTAIATECSKLQAVPLYILKGHQGQYYILCFLLSAAFVALACIESVVLKLVK